MGASQWRYVTPYATDLNVVLARLRQQVFDSHDYYWPADPDSDSWEPEWPTTMADLADPDGTHSILDITTVIGSDEPDKFGTLRLLTAAERHQCLGTAPPTHTEFDQLRGETVPRRSGHAVVLHDGDGNPTHIGIWGSSGD
jgi:hypothetical protein